MNTRTKFNWGHTFVVECFDKDGNLKWRENVENLVTNEGLNDILDKYYRGSAYTAAHYLGLTDSTSFSATDTMSSHPGWGEVTAYSETSRPQIQWDAVSNQSISNATNKATYSINANATVAGVFISTDSTKGGTTGLLIAEAAFTTARSLANGDTLTVQVTVNASSS